MAVDSTHGDVAPASVPVARRRRRHRSRRHSSRAIRRQFTTLRIQRLVFLALVIVVSLGVAFWISHRDPGVVLDPVH